MSGTTRDEIVDVTGYPAERVLQSGLFSAVPAAVYAPRGLPAAAR
jgi:hypothetical protein